MFPTAAFIIFKRTGPLVSKKSQVDISLFALFFSHSWRGGEDVALANTHTCDTDGIAHKETHLYPDAILARNESGPQRQEPVTNAPSGAQGQLGKRAT